MMKELKSITIRFNPVAANDEVGGCFLNEAYGYVLTIRYSCTSILIYHTGILGGVDHKQVNDEQY